jgi:polysaccharide biosynthesis transport protein
MSTEKSTSEEHRWLPALFMGLVLAACAGAVVMYFYTPQYEASALLMINETRPFIAFAPHDTGDESQRYVQSQIELLRSPAVLAPVLSRPEIATLPELSDARDRVQYLHDRISIKQMGASELYTVAYTSTSPQAAANVVNAVMAGYLNMHTDDEFQRSQRVIDILEEERGRMGLEVERLRSRIMDLSAEISGLDPFSHDAMLDANDVNRRVFGIRDRLMDIALERETLQAENEYLKQQAEANKEHGTAPVDPDPRLAIASGIQALQVAGEDNELVVEQIKRSDAKWSDNPLYVRLDETVRSQRSVLDKVKQELRELPSGVSSDSHELSPEQSSAAIACKLAALAAREQFLSKQLAELIKVQMDGRSRVVELEFARAELSREEKVYELISDRKLALQTELRAPARIQLAQKASVPLEPAARAPYKLLAIACSAALLAPFAITIAIRRSTSDLKQSNGAT